MFLRSLSRDYILLMNNSIEMHSAQIIGKVCINIYRNQDKKTVINNVGNDIFTDYSYSFANNSF